MVVALGLLTLMHSREREHTLYSHLHEESKELNVMIDATLRHDMMTVDNDGLNKLVARVGKMEVMKRVSILDATGKITRSSQQQDIGKTEAYEEIRAIRNSNSRQVELRRDENGDAFMWALTPIPADDGCISCHSEVAHGAARGSSEIAQNISGIMQAAQITTSGATDTEGAASELASMAGALQNLVGQFQIGGTSEESSASESHTTLPMRVVDDFTLRQRRSAKDREPVFFEQE